MVERIIASTRTKAGGALEGLRVLQLASPLVNYAGKLFAELGAEVILIEPPLSSSEGRLVADTAETRTEAEISFAYFNTSKRSITINLDSLQGQQIFRNLSKSAQLILESETPGLMQRRGLDYASLATSNPSLVMASITPFGQDGPYAQYESEDITLLALGGLLSLGGYPDTAPTAAWGQQGYLAANQFGAVAALMALLDAESGARGQHVDVSVQECIVLGLENAVHFHALEGVTRKRYGSEQREAGSGVFSCKDGQVFLLAGGIGATAFWGNFCQWMLDEGVTDAAALQGDHWSPAYRRTLEAKTLFERIFHAYSLQRTKDELYAMGQARRVPICPINTPRDALCSRQLQSRGFFIDVTDAAGNSMTMPGAPYKMSGTPWHLKSAAPFPGQDNQMIFGELGFVQTDLVRLAKEGVI